MIQYTGTSSRSNYNDERTATIGLALGSLGGQALDPRPFLAAHLLSSSCFSCSFPSLSFPPLTLSLSFSLFFPLFTSLYLVSFASAPPSGERPRCSPVLRTATRANITTGSSRGHGVTVDGSLGAVSPIPWNYHGATMGVHPAGSASSAGYVLHANDHRSAGLSSFVRSYRFCLSLSLHDSINVVNVSILAFRRCVSVLES